MRRPQQMLMGILCGILSVFLSALRADTPLEGTEFEYTPSPPQAQSSPAVAGNADTGFVVAWVDSAGILAQRFQSDGTLRGAPVEVATTGSRPAVAMNEAGRFVVVWAELNRDGADLAVVGRCFDERNVSCGADFQINTYTTGSQNSPRVVMDSAGGFTVVWGSRDQDGSASSVFGRRFDVTGSPLGGEFAVNSQTVEWQLSPDIAINTTTGEFVVVWESYVGPGQGSDAMARHFDAAGIPDAVEFQVNTEDVGYILTPRTSMNDAGEFVVVWSRPDVSDYGIFGRVLDRVDPALPEFEINTFTTGYQGRPEVAMGSGGTFLIVWESFGQDGSGKGVFGREFDQATEAPLGPDFQVNTDTLEDQRVPVVAAHGVGRYVTLWSSDEDGVVHGQRFSPSCPPPGPVGLLTVASADAGASLVLSWTDAAFASGYVVFDELAPDGPFVSAVGEAVSGSPGLTIPMPPGLRYFLVAPRNFCGLGPL